MRTYSREHFEEARRSWLGFGWKWQHIRRIAAERGFIYAPAGDASDDRDVESPSQRAILWRALEDNPTELERIVRRSSSWSQVIDQVIGMEGRLREEFGETERDIAWAKRELPDHIESAQTVGSILQRMKESV